MEEKRQLFLTEFQWIDVGKYKKKKIILRTLQLELL